ncbi:alkaline phosphatase family protein [Halorarius halobius]|uniref:alkaline phosphatase family protein n=1 Tax=Halorarius halobius TaxID=2962671 RepID=UPI0020CFE1DA|nr:alkaline phosphatase family protein [Halorarius halobius]
MSSGDSTLTTLLVGVDAACLSVLEPLFDDGELPTLSTLFTEGAAGDLESQIPPWTASAWPSIYTGVNPGKHGVFGFLRFEGHDWDVVNYSHVRRPSVWELLDACGLSSVVVNVPVTNPPRPIDGAVLPGYVAPEEPTCHPPGLLADVEAEIGPYRVYAPRDGDDEQVAWYRRLTEMRGEAFRYLARRFDPDFGFLQFQQTDTVFHERPGDDEAVREVYRAVDAELAKTLSACDPTNVLLVSDHGMGRYDGWEFRVNEYLREHGYVTATNGGRGMPSWVTARESRLLTGDDDTAVSPGALERALAALARLGLTTQRAAALLDAVGLREVVARHVPTAATRAAEQQVDFGESMVYLRDAIELGVRINLDGREPDGVVPPEEYEAFREELIDLLAAAETPDGDPVFDRVVPRETYFDGPESGRAVDVVTVPREFDVSLSTKLGGGPFGPPEEPWNHKLMGCFAAVGDAFDGATDPGTPHIFDVAPTVLSTFDRPRDERMDGEVMPVADDCGERRYELAADSRTERTEDAEVAARLSELGYLE